MAFTIITKGKNFTVPAFGARIISYSETVSGVSRRPLVQIEAPGDVFMAGSSGSLQSDYDDWNGDGVPDPFQIAIPKDAVIRVWNTNDDSWVGIEY